MTTAQEEITERLQRHVAGSAPVRETNEYRAALRTRVKELRSQGVQYPEATAREQLQRESQRRSEAEERRDVHESMTHRANAAQARDEWAGVADKTNGADRTNALLMAQLHNQIARDRT